ncbi:MAG: hypothetical protein IV090_01510 [Candidatus Sericytochromatia bacterium]|nr:hypothetical protein [Candidatus Sericytochromatia bacterium]
MPESEHSASSILYDTTLDYPEAQPSDRPTLLLDQQYHSLLAQIQPIQTHLVNQEKKIRAQLKHEQELALSLGDESELSEEELMNAYDEITDRGNSQITKNLHFQRQLKGIENSLALYLSYRQKAKLKQRPRTCKPRLYLQAALLDSDLSIYLYGRIENPPETCGLSAVRPKAVIVAMGKNPSNKPSSAVQWQADRFIIHQELDSEHLPFNAVDMTSGEIPDSDEMSKPTLIQIKSCLSGKDCLVSNSQELHHFSIEVIAGFQ